MQLLPLVLIVLGFVAVMMYLRRPAEVPEVFDKTLTFQAAMQQSEETGKPIFALVTADWCPPCQHYKRNALSDQTVAKTLRDETVPLYVDADTNREAMLSLAQMGAFGPGQQVALPTTVLVRGSTVVGSAEGVLPTSRVLSLVEAAAR